MITLGIDLAGNPKNPSGVCVLRGCAAETFILYTDEEMVNKVEETQPDIICIDAPLIYPPKVRECDRELKKYGAMPPTMPSMSVLSERGYRLAKKLRKFKVIEVFPTASAKIIGIYSRNPTEVREALLKRGLIVGKISTKHETDAVVAALTGKLYLEGSAEKVGDVEGEVIVPKLFIPEK